MQKSPLLLALAMVLLDCAALSPLPQNTCGNGVVDLATEDCDSFPSTCGAPSSTSSSRTSACRLTCDRATAGSCPTGWGCSTDGICRQSTASFESASAPFSAGAATLLTGDFDGDGRIDIIGAAPFGSEASARAHFFDDTATLASTSTIDVGLRLPVVRDLNGDGLDDLGFALSSLNVGAVGALGGRADRTFATLLFPSFKQDKLDARPVVITAQKGRALPDVSGSAVVAVAQTQGGNRLLSFSSATLTGTATLDVPYPIAPTQIVGVPQSGTLFASSLGSCGEVVVGYNDDLTGHVLIDSPCTVDKNKVVRWKATAQPRTDLKLPGKLLRRGLVVTDVNADGLDDVLADTSTGILVALATAGSTLDTFKPTEATELPFAYTELNSNTKLDAVFPSGVLVVSPSASQDAGVADDLTLAVRPRDGQRWADVRVGRFNGDEIPDVLAMYPDSLDVELYGNSGDGRFTTFTVRSEQPVRAIASGDFDGDRIVDVAFLQSPRPFDDPAGSGEVELEIAYGRSTGGPESPRIVGRFANARGLLALPNTDTAVDNLAVLESIPVEGALPTASFTILFGSGQRQAVAPLFLRDENSASSFRNRSSGPGFQIWQPVSLAAGAFRAKGATDVFSFATGLTFRPEGSASLTLDPTLTTGGWLAKADTTSQGGLAEFQEVLPLAGGLTGINPSRVANESVFEVSVVAAAGDVDVPKNEVDEIVTLGRNALGETSLYVIRAADSPRPSTVVVPTPGIVVAGGDILRLLDVDADGALDVVALTTVGADRKVIVFFNDGKGTFRTPSLEVPITTKRGDEPTGFAQIPVGVRANGALRTDLVITTEKHLYRGTLRADGNAFDVEDLTSLLGAVSKLTSVAGGDFDGDGVTDISVADSGAIRILRQKPRLR